MTIQIYDDLLRGEWDQANPTKARDQWAQLQTTLTGFWEPPDLSGPNRSDYDSGMEYKWDYRDWIDQRDKWREQFGQDAWDAYHAAQNEAAAQYREEHGDRVSDWKKIMGVAAGAAAIGPALAAGGGSTGATTYPYVAGGGTTAGSGALTSGVVGGGTAAGGATGALTAATLPNIAAVAPTTVAAGGATGGGFMASLPSWLMPALQVGSSLLGGRMASESAEDAIEAQTQANRESLDYLRESRDIALGLAEPYRQSSLSALQRMMTMAGLEPSERASSVSGKPAPPAGSVPSGQPFDITDDPGYQFRQDEGMRALENSAAARGNLNSGGFARRALRYSQGLASQEYGRIYDRLASIAGLEPVGQEMSTALNYGSNSAAVSRDTGAARASGYIAQGNAWQNAMDQIALTMGQFA